MDYYKVLNASLKILQMICTDDEFTFQEAEEVIKLVTGTVHSMRDEIELPEWGYLEGIRIDASRERIYHDFSKVDAAKIVSPQL